MKYVPIAIFVLCLGFVFFLPTFVFAQSGLVECNGPDCNFCTAVSMANNIIKWLIGILVVVAVFVFVIAGFRLVTSGGDESAKTFFKARLLNIVIGFVLVLAAWLIVDAVLEKTTKRGGLELWGTVSCGGQLPPESQTIPDLNFESDDPSASPNNTGITSGGVTPQSVTPDTKGMVSLGEKGVTVANWSGITGPGRTDQTHPKVAEAALRAQEIGRDKYGENIFQVTAAFTEGVGHSKNSKHYEGIAVDFDPLPGYSTTQVAEVVRQAGFTFVLDEGSHVHGDMR